MKNNSKNLKELLDFLALRLKFNGCIHLIFILICLVHYNNTQ